MSLNGLPYDPRTGGSSPLMNPYAPPAAPGPEPEPFVKPGPWTVDYFGGFGVIHSHNNWMLNSLLCGLAGLVPIAGLMVQFGYMYENVESLHRTHGKRLLDFEFNRFGEYLVRGLGPFLIVIIVGVGMSIVNAISGLAMGGGLNPEDYFRPGQQPDIEGFFVHLGFDMARNMSITYMLQLFLQPVIFALSLRGGLSNQVGESFNVQEGMRYCQLNYFATMGASVIYFLIAFPLSIFGFSLCFVGIFPVAGYLILFNAWLAYQLYRLYLSRGGSPIPLKPSPAMNAMIVE